MTPYLFFLFPPPSPSLFRRTEKESCKVAGGEGEEKRSRCGRGGREKGRCQKEVLPSIRRERNWTHRCKRRNRPFRPHPPSAPAMYIERHIEKR